MSNDAFFLDRTELEALRVKSNDSGCEIVIESTANGAARFAYDPEQEFEALCDVFGVKGRCKRWDLAEPKEPLAEP